MSAIVKQFFEWIKIKEKLHNTDAEPPLVKERDLWWVSFGENIGSEMNGKSKLFSRPGLVIKKLSRGFYLIAPTTSQKKEGTWYVPMRQEGKDMFVCLHQVRTIDYRRLSTRLGVADEEDFRRVKEAFQKLYK
ncbi:MAG: type II toxin-antitoxin system PemK/MazF family toxin [Patescibacteria group bacterium]